MWLLYRNTHNPLWRRNALTWSWRIEEAKNHAGTHDLGFMLGCTFGNGYALTGEQSMRDVMLTAASTLATRFNPTVGAIRSWDHNAERWSFPVIIDNMMNLELMFRATELTGDSTYRNIAIAHANTTMRNHFRPDRSSYHASTTAPPTAPSTSASRPRAMPTNPSGRAARHEDYTASPCATATPPTPHISTWPAASPRL